MALASAGYVEPPASPLLEADLATAVISMAAVPPVQVESAAAASHLLRQDGSCACVVCAATAEPHKPYARTSGTLPKRGRPLPRAPIRAFAERTTPHRMVLTGPDFVGCSSVLQGL